jgi:hypothetical protein
MPPHLRAADAPWEEIRCWNAMTSSPDVEETEQPGTTCRGAPRRSLRGEASGKAFGEWPKRARGAASVQWCASPGYRRPAVRAEVRVFEVDTPIPRRSLSAEFSHLRGPGQRVHRAQDSGDRHTSSHSKASDFQDAADSKPFRSQLQNLGKSEMYAWQLACNQHFRKENITMLKGFTPVVLGLTLLASPAFAKPARHCVDGSKNEITVTAAPGQTLAAQCKAAGGKWVRVKAASSKTTPTTPATPATPTTPNN